MAGGSSRVAVTVWEPLRASSSVVVIVCSTVASPAGNTTVSCLLSAWGAVLSTCSHTVSSSVVSPSRVRVRMTSLPSSTASAWASSVTNDSSSSMIPLWMRLVAPSWRAALTGFDRTTWKRSLYPAMEFCRTSTVMAALVSPGAKVSVPVLWVTLRPSPVKWSWTLYSTVVVMREGRAVSMSTQISTVPAPSLTVVPVSRNPNTGMGSVFRTMMVPDGKELLIS